MKPKSGKTEIAGQNARLGPGLGEIEHGWFVADFSRDAVDDFMQANPISKKSSAVKKLNPKSVPLRVPQRPSWTKTKRLMAIVVKPR
jgi:hypothetical protein